MASYLMLDWWDLFYLESYFNQILFTKQENKIQNQLQNKRLWSKFVL